MPRKKTPEIEPVNPFRIITIPPRKSRKATKKRIEDHVDPSTPVFPWQRQPGISDPNRPPPKKLLTEALSNEFLTTEDAAEVAATLKLLCLEGNLDAIKYVFDRLEGKVVNRSESGKAGQFSAMDGLAETMDEDFARNLIAAEDRFKKESS